MLPASDRSRRQRVHEDRQHVNGEHRERQTEDRYVNFRYALARQRSLLRPLHDGVDVTVHVVVHRRRAAGGECAAQSGSRR